MQEVVTETKTNHETLLNVIVDNKEILVKLNNTVENNNKLTEMSVNSMNNIVSTLVKMSNPTISRKRKTK
jgi:hypothetical protein